MKKNKHIRKEKNKSEETVTNSVEQEVIKSTKLLIIPISGLLLLFVIWLNIFQPKVIDDWYRGAALIDLYRSSGEKTIYLDSAGMILSEQVKKHPYHARVWFLYGYYQFNRNNWDSCIICQKKAIELGVGGIVNQVEFDASNMMNVALANRLIGLYNLPDSALSIIRKAETDKFYNPGIDKFKGIVFANSNKIDSSIFLLERFLKNRPPEIDVLTALAIDYTNKQDIPNAVKYTKQAQQIDANNPTVINLLQTLRLN